MSKYDTSDVKSVQKFLSTMKAKFDAVNGALPEGTEQLDYDGFVDSFFKANDGILKNRDALKQEKLSVVEELEKTKGDYEAKMTSIDEKHKSDYNAVVGERDALKATMKDGQVDIDGINAKFDAEKAQMVTEFEAQLKEKTAELMNSNTELTDKAGTFEGLYFETLKTSELSSQLDRIKVGAEHKSLIIDANLSRAQITQDDKGNYNVGFKDGDNVAKSDAYWDSWAKGNQQYISAGDNTGGGASGSANVLPTSGKEQIMAKLSDPTLPLDQWMSLNSQLDKMDD